VRDWPDCQLTPWKLANTNAKVHRSASRLSRILIVLVLLASVGGHWMLLQSVAWTRMIVERSRAASFTEAVQTTFDGAHPCSLCKRIAEGRQGEKQPAKAPVAAKIDLLLERRIVTLLPPSERIKFSMETRAGLARTERPPVPPPRAA
jgi:hypothetical protein